MSRCWFTIAVIGLLACARGDAAAGCNGGSRGGSLVGGRLLTGPGSYAYDYAMAQQARRQYAAAYRAASAAEAYRRQSERSQLAARASRLQAKKEQSRQQARARIATQTQQKTATPQERFEFYTQAAEKAEAAGQQNAAQAYLRLAEQIAASGLR